jgi:hypothetical protein
MHVIIDAWREKKMSKLKNLISISIASLLLQVFSPQIVQAQIPIPISDPSRLGNILPEPIAELFRDIANIVGQIDLRNISNQLALVQQLDNMSFYEMQEDQIARSLMLSMQGESTVALDKLTVIRDREALSILKASTYHQGLMSIPGQYLVN